MNAIPAAMVTTMRTDETLAGLVGLYKTVPAIFYGPGPAEVDKPFVVVMGPKPSAPWMGKATSVGWDCTFTVLCVAYNARVALEIAHRVFQVFHRTPFEIDGYHCAGVSCSGPEMADYDTDFVSFTVGVNVKANEQESEGD